MLSDPAAGLGDLDLGAGLFDVTTIKVAIFGATGRANSVFSGRAWNSEQA